MKTILSLASFLILLGCSNDALNKNENTLQGLNDLNADQPEIMSLHISKYNPQTGNVLKDVFVSNFSVKNDNGKLVPSSSRDSMSDDLKLALRNNYGFAVDKPQSR